MEVGACGALAPAVPKQDEADVERAQVAPRDKCQTGRARREDYRGSGARAVGSGRPRARRTCAPRDAVVQVNRIPAYAERYSGEGVVLAPGALARCVRTRRFPPRGSV